MTNAKIEPQALVPFLSDRYGMSPDVTCSFIRRGGNDHYVVEDRGRKYVLRLYLNGKYFIRSADDFRFELDLVHFLLEQGLPVAASIPDVDGKSLVRFESNGERRLVALFDFAAGEDIWETMGGSHARELGSTVARLHLAMDRFSSEHSRYHLDLVFLLEEPLRLLEVHPTYRGKGSLEFLRKLAGRLRETVSQTPTEGGAYGLIHGDLGWHNIHYHPDSGMKIFDFDLCGYGWRAFDLALVKLQFDDDHWAAFIDAYQAVRPMSAAERNSIGDFVQLWPMWHIGDLLRNRNPILQLGNNSIEEEIDGWLGYLKRMTGAGAIETAAQGSEEGR